MGHSLVSANPIISCTSGDGCTPVPATGERMASELNNKPRLQLIFLGEFPKLLMFKLMNTIATSHVLPRSPG